jgi:hypothetical protein
LCQMQRECHPLGETAKRATFAGIQNEDRQRPVLGQGRRLPWRLSLRRAVAVKAYLAGKGTESSRIFTEGR